METRDRKTSEPYVQSLVRTYPKSMSASLLFSIARMGLKIYESSPLAILHGLQVAILLYGVVNEVLRMSPHHTKMKNNFSPICYPPDSDDIETARLYVDNNSTTPVIENYSSEDHVQGMAAGNLRGPEFIQMREKYYPLMHLMARIALEPNPKNFLEKVSLIPNVLLRKEMQDTIAKINYEVWLRNINISDIMTRRHFFLLELNQAVLRYNQDASIPASFVTIEELFALDFFSSIVKPIKPDDLLPTLIKKAIGSTPVIACTSAYIKKQNKMFHLLDWPTSNYFANGIAWTKRPTGNTEKGKPTFVYTLGIAPDHPVAIGINDELVITINEVCQIDNMEKNPEGGFGPFDMMQKILDTCMTIDDVEQLIKKFPPASPWILSVMSKTEGAVIDLLPPKKPEEESAPLYRIKRDNFVATNFFQKMPETAAVPCALERYEKMEKAQQNLNMSDWEKARASASDDTCVSMIARWENDELILEYNIANFNSSISEDPVDNVFRPDKMNIHQDAKQFLEKCNQHAVKPVPIHPVDKELMKLCLASVKIKDAEVAQLMRKIYSTLMVENSRNYCVEQKEKSVLDTQQIKEMAKLTRKIALGEASQEELKRFEENLLRLDPGLRSTMNYFCILTGIVAVVAGLFSMTNSLTAINTGLTWIRNNFSTLASLGSIAAPLQKVFSSPSSPSVFFFANSLAEKCRNLTSNGEELKKDNLRLNQ